MSYFSLSLSPPRSSPKFHHQSPPKTLNHFKSVIEICRTHEEFSQIHSLFIKTSQIQNPNIFTQLLYSFASLSNPNSLSHAQKLFNAPNSPKNSFIYNTLIKHYSKIGEPELALLIFSQMLCDDVAKPDDFTYTFVCNTCSKTPSLFFVGKQVHALMVKSLSRSKTQSWNSLMGFYVKIGEDVTRVSRIFDEIGEVDVVSWNCLLDGYVKVGDLNNAQRLFDEMPKRDVVSWTSMLVGYCNVGLVSKACILFDKMPKRTMVSWTAMINGYLQACQYQEALAVFAEMQGLGVKIDHITLTTLLSVCARLGALEQGQWAHTYIDRHGYEADPHMLTALVDMYAKCGKIDLAYKNFRESKCKNKIFLWNAILGGLAMHSLGEKALQLFSEMLEFGVKPNEITFICVLSACSHSGLIDEGLHVLDTMAKDHKIIPKIEHYNCIIDLLGRKGLLQEAKGVLEKMPMQADANILRALLSACRVHGDVEMGEEVGRILIELDPSEDGNYVLLSNIYAENRRWGDVEELRKMMVERGVRKSPGCSSIELNGVVHEFIAKDESHCRSLEIYRLLNELGNQIADDEEY